MSPIIKGNAPTATGVLFSVTDSMFRSQEIEFAADSPLEGTGFELSVPREMGPWFEPASGAIAADERAQPTISNWVGSLWLSFAVFQSSRKMSSAANRNPPQTV